MKPNIYKETCQKFIQFEADENLLFVKIQDVYIWQTCRALLFYAILDQLIPVQNDAGENTNKIKKLLSFCYRFFVNMLFYNPFVDYRKGDVLVFESGRKYLRENEYIDIYTKYLVEKLSKEDISTTTYEYVFHEKETFFKGQQHVKHIDALRTYSKIIQKFSKFKFSDQELSFINQLQTEINTLFNVSLDLKSIFDSQIKQFKSEKILYDRLFKIKKPKEIYLVNSADKTALIAAAKENDIIVNELQHGLNSQFDIVSNFPLTEKESLQYFPNQFYIWNNVSMFSAVLPLENQHIKYIPNYHLDFLREQTHSINKESNCILIASQPYSSAEIQQYLIDNIADLSDYAIYYKIHPVEDISKVKALQNQLSHYNNLHFVMNEESIYVLMKRAHYIIGIYSSALFESTAFDCKIILLNLPGVEMAACLSEAKKAILVDTKQKLINHL